jgi:hypothetical protein
VSAAAFNPELLRNLRAQLRPGRMISVASICVALSLAVGYATYRTVGVAPNPEESWGFKLLQFAVYVQAIAITFGGAIACLLALHREKEMNTFDFQRLTRLSPLEFTFGKLFGAPATVYFVVLCFLPAALVGMIASGVHPGHVLAAYAVMLLGALVWHALGLTVSLLVERGGSTGAVVLLVFLLWFAAIPSTEPRLLALGPLSPLFAGQLIGESLWNPATRRAVWGAAYDPMTDVFFGVTLSHVPVLLLLYATFLFWFLLALARNIKRDPAVYEPFSLAQSLALAFYVNVLILGLFRWQAFRPDSSLSILVGLNAALFWALGLAALRNRERWRRRLRALGERTRLWLEAVWPAPLLLAGLVPVSAAVLWLIHTQRPEKFSWDSGLGAFVLAALLAWLVRELLFLQWMNLGRSRRALVMGVLYLFVFYVSASLVLFAVGGERNLLWQFAWLLLMPFYGFWMESKLWAENQVLWLSALAGQAAFMVFLAFLQRGRLSELSSTRAGGG